VSGKQIKLFLVDGTPGGLTTAEITNWTGHVLTGNRSELSDLCQREETSRTGVYLLLREDEDALGNTRCYIGETDVIANRLRSPDHAKKEWDRVVIITSKDANLTKAHARYLESRLIELAKAAARVSVENSTAPGVPALPEADRSDMDYFVSQLQIVLPVLGVNAIRVKEPKVSKDFPVFHLRHAKSGVDARAQEIDGEFTMLAGSKVVASWHGIGNAASTRKAYTSYRNQHEQLIAQGSIVVEDEHGRLTRNVVFPAPSPAGAIALGRSCNGRREWIASDGTTFGEWESRGVE